MKKIITIIFLIITLNIWGQFSISTELKYLQIVNKQGNIDLIEDNLKNAELATDSLINLGNNSLLFAQFFNELSESYFLTKKYEMSLFSLLRQRCLFPNKSIEQEYEVLFLETAYRCNLSDSISKLLLKESSFAESPRNYSKKIEKLLELSVKVKNRELSSYIYNIGLQLRLREKNIPIWYQHWEFLTLINLKEKKKSQALICGVQNAPIYLQITDKKLKYKVYRKTIKHYIKTNSFRQAKNILQEYKTNKLPLFLKIDAFFKNLRILIKL